MKSYLSIAAATVLTLTLTTGCNDDHDSTPYVPPVTTIETYYGVFATPSAANGIEYKCTDVNGDIIENNTTIKDGADGVFGPCQIKKPVVFSIGGIEVGEFTAKDTVEKNNVVTATNIEAVTPVASPKKALVMAAAPTTTAPAATIGDKVGASVATLDADHDPKNGCTVEADAAKSFAKAVEKSGGFEKVEADALVDTIVETAKEEGIILEPVKVDEAKTVQEETDKKVESGDLLPPPPPPPVIVEPTPPPTGS